MPTTRRQPRRYRQIGAEMGGLAIFRVWLMGSRRSLDCPSPRLAALRRAQPVLNLTIYFISMERLWR